MTIENCIKKIVNKDLRFRIRVVLQNIKRFIHLRKKIQTSYQLYTFENKDCDTFFGYYDITPFNKNEDILYVELSKEQSFINIVKNNTENTDKQYLAKSYAWNWQQGCRLRWFAESNNVISFNDFDGNIYFNRIIDIEANEEKYVQYPLYDIDKKGKYGLTLNFERLGVLRPGYGYSCRSYIAGDLNKESIGIVDISNNTIIEEIKYPQIVELLNKDVDINNCYINHLSFSPSGDKFLFFWIEIINGFHQASLIVYDLKKKKLIPLELDYKVSHYVWDREESIICTAYDADYKCRYYRYIIDTQERIIVNPKTLFCDGHPSFYLDRDNLLTDTYPDSAFFQHLKIANIEEDSTYVLVTIYSDPFINGKKRTDLHPRFNYDKTMVCFDANICRHRKMYIFKLK